MVKKIFAIDFLDDHFGKIVISEMVDKRFKSKTISKMYEKISCLERLLQDSESCLVGENIKEKLKTLMELGFAIFCDVFDFDIARSCVNSGLFTKAHIAKSYDCLLKEYDFLLLNLHKHSVYKYFSEIEMKVLPVIVQMEKIGIPFDSEEAKKEIEVSQKIHDEILKKHGDDDIIKLAEKCIMGGGVVERTERGDVVTTKQALSKIKNDFAKDLIRAKELKSEIDCIKRFLQHSVTRDKESRVYPTCKQVGTVTFRLSSENPSDKNINRSLRKFFKSKKSSMVVCDFSNIDLRVIADISKKVCGTGGFYESFLNGRDPHLDTAKKFENLTGHKFTRDEGKASNFAFCYGGGFRGYMKSYNLEESEAKRAHKAFKEIFPEIRAIIRQIGEVIKERGYVKNIFGLRRYFNAELPQHMLWWEATKAFNWIIQSSSAGICKKAMVDIKERLLHVDAECRIIFQIHDEIGVEVESTDKTLLNKVKNIVKSACENCINLNVRLDCEAKFGESWGDCK